MGDEQYEKIMETLGSMNKQGKRGMEMLTRMDRRLERVEAQVGTIPAIRDRVDAICDHLGIDDEQANIARVKGTASRRVGKAARPRAD